MTAVHAIRKRWRGMAGSLASIIEQRNLIRHDSFRHQFSLKQVSAIIRSQLTNNQLNQEKQDEREYY
jgi:hypothetical protein